MRKRGTRAWQTPLFEGVNANHISQVAQKVRGTTFFYFLSELIGPPYPYYTCNKIYYSFSSFLEGFIKVPF